MFAKVLSAGLMGIEAFLIEVEVDIRLSQLPKWQTVGLPESAVRESKDRVVAAIRNSGYEFIFRKVTINLAPADTKKEGTAFDLPIAVGLMVASGELNLKNHEQTLMVGELSLTGELRSVRGALPIAIMAREKGYTKIILPKDNAYEASMVQGLDVYGFDHFSGLVEFIKGNEIVEPAPTQDFLEGVSPLDSDLDFSEIYGQYQAKRAMEVAAAGGHNILLCGSPGAGKSMIASRIPTILPSLTFEESLETSKIYSIMGLLKNKERLLTDRPFRDPHHSVSNAGLIGGGSIPRPGEVSLAHNGVLFLDELPEFQKNILELLRQPLETHEVTISRAAMSLSYPARFILVASCNPCPCGYSSHPKIQCQCPTPQIQRYRSRLSGPLLDRIDIQIEVPPVPYEDLRAKKRQGESSKDIAVRVKQVRDIQTKRFKGTSVYMNSQMGTRMIEQHCKLDVAGEKVLKASMEKFNLSARGLSRILKVSRTLADMEGLDSITMDHVLEAVQYRGIDWAAGMGRF